MLRPLSLTRRHTRIALGTAAVALAGGAGWLAYAQIAGDRGIAAVAASSDIEVGGITVDVHADTSEEARDKGYVEAQRKAWEQIKGPKLADSQIAAMVSAMVVEREQLGPKRYIATLGVVFDRSRASQYLGAGEQAARSAPMLLVPVTFSAGTQTVYEQRNPWQRAWAEYQPGASRIDYVRPVGSGGDSILVTYGQTGRRSRTWWRNVLDQFGAADVLIAIANLRYTYPGGPVEGRFTARFGPDDTMLGSFTLKADSPEQLPAMLAKAVRQFNTIYEGALAGGRLRPDPTLNVEVPELSPVVQALIAQARAEEAKARAEAAARAAVDQTRYDDDGAVSSAPVNRPPPEGSVALYTVQVATPDAAAFDTAVGAIRRASGVKAAGVRSTAIGGTSVMTVSFAGSIDGLAAALRARGLTVSQSGSALVVSR